MRVLFFGTYDEGRHPRVEVLREGLAANGCELVIVNRPISITTQQRLEITRRPWKAAPAVLELLRSYWLLAKAARAAGPVDAVVVGYLGILDIHLARRLFRAPIVLDHMAPVRGTFVDRRVTGLRLAVAGALDRWAERAASLVLVDTAEHLEHLDDPSKGLVVPVGAPSRWFCEPSDTSTSVSFVFFGLYTPLQGIEQIANALLATADLDVRWTLIGDGQDRELAQTAIDAHPHTTVLDWVQPDQLPEVVASHDVCLGIFGTTPKAQRVVPNKVYQGAAAGCLVITSDTPCQRRALGSLAEYVQTTDPQGLANACRSIVDRAEQILDRRSETYQHAVEHFSPMAVTRELFDALRRLPPIGDEKAQRQPPRR